MNVRLSVDIQFRINDSLNKFFDIMYKVLQESYHIFVLLCICPPNKSHGKWLKFFSNIVLIFCFSVFLMSFFASWAYIIYHSDNITNLICAFWQISGLCHTIHSVITLYFKRDELKGIFDAVQTFYDASK